MVAVVPITETIPLEGRNLTLVVVVLAIALLALVMGTMFRRQVLAADTGTDKMREIGAAVEEGAQAYLARQFKTLSVFVVLVFGLLFLLPADTWSLKFGRSLFFIVGAVFSALIGYFGMSLAVKANVRVASAARAGSREDGMQDRLPHGRHGGHGHRRPRPRRRLDRRAHLPR